MITEERPQTPIVYKHKEHLYRRNSQQAGVNHPHKMVTTTQNKGGQVFLMRGSLGNSNYLCFCLTVREKLYEVQIALMELIARLALVIHDQ